MNIRLLLALTALLFLFPKHTYANQPLVEQRSIEGNKSQDPYQLYGSSMVLGDPMFSGFTVYGTLSPNSIDMYYFVPRMAGSIPIELLVPAKEKLKTFFPRLIVVGKFIAGGVRSPSDIPVPIGYESVTIDMPATRITTFDTLGLQTSYQGDTVSIEAILGEIYSVAVLDPANTGGSYALRVGTKSNFKGSVKDTATTIDANTLAFENFPRPQTTSPTTAERAQFSEQKTPFQTLDSGIRFWIDFIFFYLNRIPTLILNK